MVNPGPVHYSFSLFDITGWKSTRMLNAVISIEHPVASSRDAHLTAVAE